MQKLHFIIGVILITFILSDNYNILIDNFVENYMNENNIVGVSLAILKNSNEIHKKGYGFSDLEKSIMIDPEKTLFRWASLSKMITSLLAFNLKREMLIDFDFNIDNYYKNYTCPKTMSIKCHLNESYVYLNETQYECKNDSFAYVNIPKENQKITIRNLLTHWSGIMEYDDGIKSPVPPEELINSQEYNKGVEWAVNYFKDLPLVNIPNFKYNYTSFGYNLLGVVLMKAAKYENFENLIYDKLNLNQFSIISDKHWDNKFFPNRCSGYNNFTKTGDNDVSYKLPGGGYMSTLSDLVKFVLKLIYSDLFLNNNEKKEAWTELKNTKYGYGFEIDILNSTDFSDFGIGHTGSQEKAKNIFVYFPHNDTIIIALSNSENFSPRDFIKKLIKLIKL